MIKRINSFLILPVFQDVFRNSFWSIIASVVQRGTILIGGIIIARILDIELFGKYTLLKSTIQVFELSIGIAFGLSMTKFVSENKYAEKKRENIKSIIKTNFLSSAVLSILLFSVLEIFSGYFVEQILKSPDLLFLFRIAIFYVLFSNIFHCLIGLFKGEEEFKKIFQINLFTSLLNLLVVSVLAYFFLLKGAVLALVIFSFIQLAAYSFVIWKKTDHFNVLFDKNISIDYKLIKQFNLPAILSGLAAPPAIWYINLTLSQTPNGFKELAHFNVAFLIFGIIVFLPVSVADAIFPLLNKFLSKVNGFRKFFLANLFLIFIIASIFSLVPIFYSDLVLSLFGNEYKAAGNALKYLSIAAIFSSLLTVLGKFNATINKMWINLLFNIFWAILVVTFTIYFINEGSTGVAKAFLFSYFLLFMVQFIYSIVKIKKLA